MDTIPRNFRACDYIANVRTMFVFDASKVNIICCYWLVLFVHKTVLQIGEVLVDERCIMRFEVTFFVSLFFVRFDVEYLSLGEI